MPVLQRSFCCSVCDKSFTNKRQCAQHCSQPHSLCNRGKTPENFATPIEVLIRVGHDNRVVGGTASRGDRDRGHDSAAAAASCSGSQAAAPGRARARSDSDSDSDSDDHECDLDSAGGLGLGTGDSNPDVDSDADLDSGDVAAQSLSL